MRCRGLACVALLTLSCLRDDPNHCANRKGDATCRDMGVGQFCSACGTVDFGCVADRPEDACHVESPPGEASTSNGPGSEGSGSESEDASSSGPPPACTLEGEADPSCPEDAPYCIGGECGTCDQGDADFCSGLDPAKPACHAPWGRCAECTPDDASACSGNDAWCGLDFTCGGCTEHAQCPGTACNLETGRCLDDALVMHVNNAICPDPGSGTETTPYCSIATAVSQVPSGEVGTIFLHGTTDAYDEGILLTSNPPRTVAVIGVDEPTIVVPGSGWAASVATGNTLLVGGVRLSSGTGSGVQCIGATARLWLDDATVNNNVDGVVATSGCKARLRRVRVIDSDGNGVHVSDGADLRLWSSVIGNNGVVDLPVSGLHVHEATIDVRYTTIANNASVLAGKNVYCTAGGGGEIRNSILVAPGLDSIDCPWAQTFFSVHDNVELAGSDNYDVETFNADWFVNVPSSDFHVRGTNSSPFRDRARWELGDPILDFDGERRDVYPGAPGFAGADEP